MTSRLHRRCEFTNAASKEFETAYLAVADKHNLTHAEVADLLTSHLRQWVKIMLQRERHPFDNSKHESEE